MERREHTGIPAGAPDADAAPLGVFTTDTSLVVRTWDAWLARATGIPAAAARGRPLTELAPELTDRGLLASFDRVLAGGAVEILAPALHQYLIACPPRTPSRTFERMQQRVTIGPLRGDDRIVGAIVAIEDVTGRVERERELAEQLSALEPGVRLDAAIRLASAPPAGGVDPLIPAMGDDDWRVRRAAVEALRRRKTAATIAAVLEALRDEHRNFSVLSSAVELLAAGGGDIIEPLLELLRAPDADLRLQAALVLGSRGDARAVAPLIEALDDPDENLRFHATEALGRLKAGAAVEPLVELARAGDFFLAFPALEALSRIGDPSVAPRLAPLLADELLRGAAAEVLGTLGDEDAVAPLMRLLNDAAAPTEVVAGALASIHDRYEELYEGGECIAELVRSSIEATGTQALLDAVRTAAADQLPSIARVLGWLEGPAVDRALTRLLGQPSVRGKAVESLVKHGERVVELLVEQLDAEDLETRHAAIAGLGRIGDRRATPALIRVLDSDALTVAAAGALARIGDGAAFEPLLRHVGHPDPAVRHAVVAALNSIGHPEMAARVEPLLRHEQPRVRESAVRIAGYFGYPDCADALLARCRDEDAGVRRAALEHLPFLDDERVVHTLLAAAGDEDPVMRAAAVQALSRVEDPQAAPRLVEALTDPDPWVRYFAARALGEWRHLPAAAGLARLALDDRAGHVRLASIEALGRIGSPAAVPALAAIAASEDAEHATTAIRALGGIADPEARPPLEHALRDGLPDRRAAAALAIAAREGGAAVEALAWTAAADGDTAVIAAAVQGLASIAAGMPADSAATGALIGLAADEARRGPVIAALSSLPPERIPALARGLQDPRPDVRIAVLQALGRMRCAEASQLLLAALDDEAPEVRLAAVAELRRLGTFGVDRRLVTLARADPDAAVRRAALGALRRGDAAPAAREPGAARHGGG